MEEKKKLEVGEKYLSIKIVGHDWIKAFPNKNRKKDNEPKFKGDGVAVWVNKKQPPKQEIEEEVL